jgi:hypothetical protein
MSTATVTPAAFSPDGRALTSASANDRSITFPDAADASRVILFERSKAGFPCTPLALVALVLGIKEGTKKAEEVTS